MEKYGDIIPDEPTLDDAEGREDVLEHLKEARQKIVWFFELIDQEGWELHTDDKGVKLYTQLVEGSPLKAAKLEFEVNCSAEACLKLLRDREEFKKVEDGIKFVEVAGKCSKEESADLADIMRRGLRLWKEETLIIYYVARLNDLRLLVLVRIEV
jgi:hypothetical protein